MPRLVTETVFMDAVKELNVEVMNFNKTKSPNFADIVVRRRWGTALGVIGDYEKEAPGTIGKVNKKDLGDWSRRFPGFMIGSTRSTDLRCQLEMRAICRLYCFLAPTARTLRLCESLCKVCRPEVPLVFGTLIFANASLDDREDDRLVAIRANDLLSAVNSPWAIAEWARFGTLTGNALRSMLIDNINVSALASAWKTVFNAVPVALWLDLDMDSAAVWTVTKLRYGNEYRLSNLGLREEALQQQTDRSSRGRGAVGPLPYVNDYGRSELATGEISLARLFDILEVVREFHGVMHKEIGSTNMGKTYRGWMLARSKLKIGTQPSIQELTKKPPYSIKRKLHGVNGDLAAAANFSGRVVKAKKAELAALASAFENLGLVPDVRRTQDLLSFAIERAETFFKEALPLTAERKRSKR